MRFEVTGEIHAVESIAVGSTIRRLRYLRRRYGPARWRKSKLPRGWDEERVRRALAHYEQQNEEEAVAEDEASFDDTMQGVRQTKGERARRSTFQDE
jgi:hypothetical protein